MKNFKRELSIVLVLLILLASMNLTSFASNLSSVNKNTIGPSFGILNGASITMLRSNTASQNMGYILKTKSGKIIVVDGGLEEDGAHLKEMLRTEGGKVSAWLITHPHSDHVGALINVLNDKNSAISIEGIYYNLTDMDWYRRNEAYRADYVQKFVDSLKNVEPSVLHSKIKYGDIINIDDASIHVLNGPYLFTVNSINNSSIAYRVDMGGKRIIFLGDMGEQAGDSLISDVQASELKADIVQMAHHGQYGVSKRVYEIISPTIAMWNAPEWLYNNTSGKYLTLEVRKWMKDIGVKSNYVIKDGDQLIK